MSPVLRGRLGERNRSSLVSVDSTKAWVWSEKTARDRALMEQVCKSLVRQWGLSRATDTGGKAGQVSPSQRNRRAFQEAVMLIGMKCYKINKS